MAQQKGQKRAQKVHKRKVRLAKVAYHSNLKKAVYAQEKAAKGPEETGHEGHDHD